MKAKQKKGRKLAGKRKKEKDKKSDACKSRAQCQDGKECYRGHHLISTCRASPSTVNLPLSSKSCISQLQSLSDQGVHSRHPNDTRLRPSVASGAGPATTVCTSRRLIKKANPKP